MARNRNSTGEQDLGRSCGTAARRAALAVAAVTAALYVPALAADFVNWDDLAGIRDNHHLRSLGWRSFRWMFSTFASGNWIPLTWLSHAVDYRLWGLNPLGPHLTNVILHSLNTYLVFFLSRKFLSLARASERGNSTASEGEGDLLVPTLAALVFGIHPVHVESVAWVTERKDLLCALFYLLSVSEYLASSLSSGPNYRRLSSCFGFFCLALLSKPMAVTLPVVLLLLDAWPLRRLRAGRPVVLLEKIPFFLLSLIVGLVTVKAQSSVGAVASFERAPAAFRVMNALHSIVFYVRELVAPVELVPYHPIRAVSEGAFGLPNLLAAVIVVAVTAGCAHCWRRGHPSPLTAWIYYLVTVAPVLGIIQVGTQSAADRYTYLPSVGLGLLFASGVAQLSKAVHRRAKHALVPKLLSLPLAAWLLWLAVSTVVQIRVWENSYTLWRHVTDAYPESPFALDGLGSALLEQGLPEAAIPHLKRAVEIQPSYVPSYQSLWYAFNRLGRHEEALGVIQQALGRAPRRAEAYNSLGITLARLRRFQDSANALEKATALEPRSAEYLANLSSSYRSLGRLPRWVHRSW